MAKLIANVDVTSYTFQNWVDSTNQGLTALSVSALTATPNPALLETDGTAPLYANGTSRVGYAHVNGYFSSDNLIAGTALRGGNATSSAVLTITSNATFSGANVGIASNVALTGGNTSIVSANTTVAGGALNVTSNVAVTGALHTFGGNVNFDSNTLFVDATNNRLGLGKNNPSVTLDVVGSVAVSVDASVTGGLTVTGNTALANVALTGNVAVISANVTTFGGNTVTASANVSLTGANTSIASSNVAISGGVLNVTSVSAFAANVSISGALTSVTGNVNMDSGLVFVDAVATRVGINTVTPVSLLQVNGLFTTATANVVTGLNVPGTATISGVTSLNGVTTVANTLNVSGLLNQSANAAFTGGLNTFAGNNNFDAGVLFVDATNNRVGVGTSTPNAPLQVVGAANVSGQLTVAANIVSVANISGSVVNAVSMGTSQDILVGRDLTVTSNSLFGNTVVAGTTTLGGGVVQVNSNTTVAANLTTTGTVNIYGGNSAFDTNVLFVDSVNNRVGVGTATPNAPLQVAGAANVSGIVTVAANIVSTGTVSASIVAAANVSATNTITAANLVVTGTIDHNSIADTLSSSNTNIGTSIVAAVRVWSYSLNTYRAAKIVARVTNGGSLQAQELLIVNDTANVSSTVYATVNIGASANLGSFTAVTNVTSSTIDLMFHQTIANSAVAVYSNLIKA